MEKPTIKALLLAAAMVAPNFVASATEQTPAKHAKEFSKEELRHVLRAINFCVYESKPLQVVVDEQHKQSR